jgi:hypothetical protein
MMGLLVKVVVTIYGVESEGGSCDESEKGLREVNNPRLGRAGDGVLNDIDRLWYVMVGDAGMDTEEVEVCVDLDLVAMLELPDKDEE